MSYIDMIKERARIDKKTIVLPESNDNNRAVYEISDRHPERDTHKILI